MPRQIPRLVQIIRLQRSAGQNRKSRLMDSRKKSKKIVTFNKFRTMPGPQRRLADVRGYDDGSKIASVRRLEDMYLARQRRKPKK